MNKLELLSVLRSMKLALKNGSKEDIEELVDALIKDAEGEKKNDKQ